MDFSRQRYQFCVCSTVHMHADNTDRFAMNFPNFRGFNFRAIFIFRKIRENQTPAKKGLYISDKSTAFLRPSSLEFPMPSYIYFQFQLKFKYQCVSFFFFIFSSSFNVMYVDSLNLDLRSITIFIVLIYNESTVLSLEMSPVVKSFNIWWKLSNIAGQ